MLYNGEAKWTAATDVAELIPPVPGLVAQYLPKLSYVLIEENRYTEGELAALENLVAAVIRFEHPADPQVLLQAIDRAYALTEGNAELRRTFAIWFHTGLLRRGHHALELPETQDLKELKMTLSDRFELWARQYEQRGKEEGLREGLAKGLQEGRQEGLEKGLQEGRQEGSQLVLQKLLTKRFGPLSAEVMERIASGSSEQINRWVDRMMDAASLEEVFRLH